MATAWRDWPILEQPAIRSRLTPAQEAVVARLILRGWEIGHLYHRTLTMCRKRTMWLARCPIYILPSGKVRGNSGKIPKSQLSGSTRQS